MKMGIFILSTRNGVHHRATSSDNKLHNNVKVIKFHNHNGYNPVYR